MKVQWKTFFVRTFVYLAQAQVQWECNHPSKTPSGTCDGRAWSSCCPQVHPFTEMQTRWSPNLDEMISQIAHGYQVPSDVSFTIAGPFGFTKKLFVGLHVHRIFDIDQKARNFKMKYTLRSIWRDCRTLHNCSYLQLDDKHPEFRNFWKPQFDKQEVTDSEATMMKTRISIDPDGLVQYESDHVSTIGCEFQFEDFPFDEQHCTFTLFTPLLPWIQLDWEYQFGKAGVLYDPHHLGDWDISEFRTEEVILKGSSYRQHPDINAARAHVTFSRVSSVQVRSYVIPTMCFWFSSWCGLFIDCAAVPARAGLGVTPLLILANKMSALTTSLPPMAATCVLERYMLYNMGLMALHLFEFALVNFSMRLQRELKDEKDEEEASQDASPSPTASIRKVARWRDSFSIRYLNRNLNMHTRWVSLLAFIVINIMVLLGH